MAHRALVFIGPQGSGKGTQAALLAKKYGYRVIATGDLFRSAAKERSERGKAIRRLIERGKLVPDKLTVELLKQEVERTPEGMMIIFDGFPRTVSQADDLEALVTVERAVNITLPTEVSVKRITGRVACPAGHTYNIYYVPPKQEGVCDIDQQQLRKRSDDTEQSVMKRLALYQEVTTPVLEFYRERHKLVAINGDASVEDVFKEIEAKVTAGL